MGRSLNREKFTKKPAMCGLQGRSRSSMLESSSAVLVMIRGKSVSSDFLGGTPL